MVGKLAFCFWEGNGISVYVQTGFEACTYRTLTECVTNNRLWRERTSWPFNFVQRQARNFPLLPVCLNIMTKMFYLFCLKQAYVHYIDIVKYRHPRRTTLCRGILFGKYSSLFGGKNKDNGNFENVTIGFACIFTCLSLLDEIIELLTARCKSDVILCHVWHSPTSDVYVILASMTEIFLFSRFY